MALIGWAPTVDLVRERDSAAANAAAEESVALTNDDAIALARKLLADAAG
jgi:hypothetical protein